MTDFNLFKDVAKKVNHLSPSDRFLVTDESDASKPNAYIENQDLPFVPDDGNKGDVLTSTGTGYRWATPQSTIPHDFHLVGALSSLSTSWTRLNSTPLDTTLPYYFSVSGTVSGQQDTRTSIMPFASISTSAMALRFNATSAVYFRRNVNNIDVRRVGSVTNVQVWCWIATRGGGLPGRLGDPGDTGARGFGGEDGDRGDKGEAGKPGLKGPKGPPGFASDRGRPGDRGEKGNTGRLNIRAWSMVVGSSSESTRNTAGYTGWVQSTSSNVASVRTLSKGDVRITMSTGLGTTNYGVIATASSYYHSSGAGYAYFLSRYQRLANSKIFDLQFMMFQSNYNYTYFTLPIAFDFIVFA